jgi:hypothetical protein
MVVFGSDRLFDDRGVVRVRQDADRITTLLLVTSAHDFRGLRAFVMYKCLDAIPKVKTE